MTSSAPRPGRRAVLSLLAAGAASGTLLSRSQIAWAITDEEALVEKSRITIESLLSDPEMAQLPNYVKRSKAVLIFPQVFKGGFILGAEGGGGVMLARGSDNTWSAPAFYVLVAGSIGLQIGGQVSQAVFTLMNEKAVDAILSNQFKMGADASVAIGPIGKGVGASTTTNFSDDIYTFSKAVGLFGGGALDGAGILAQDDYNKAYYGTDVTPRDIVLNRKVFNPQADPLRRALPV